MAKNYCSKCGAELIEGKKFCHKCGAPVSSEDSEKEAVSSRSKRKAAYVLIGVLGVLLLIILGAFAYTDYSEKRAIRLAREKVVADSLEQVRKDSIKLAEQKEQERIEAEKLAETYKKLSFENFLGMLKNYNEESYAKKCGLSLLYKDVNQGDYGECLKIAYGYNVDKRRKNDWEYEILSNSNSAYYFMYSSDIDEYAEICFKDSKGADLFFEKAKKYGLIMDENGSCAIPKKKLSGGQSIKVKSLFDLDDSLRENVWVLLDGPFNRGGWYYYCIRFSFDFDA